MKPTPTLRFLRSESSAESMLIAEEVFLRRDPDLSILMIGEGAAEKRMVTASLSDEANACGVRL